MPIISLNSDNRLSTVVIKTEQGSIITMSCNPQSMYLILHTLWPKVAQRFKETYDHILGFQSPIYKVKMTRNASSTDNCVRINYWDHYGPAGELLGYLERVDPEAAKGYKKAWKSLFNIELRAFSPRNITYGLSGKYVHYMRTRLADDRSMEFIVTLKEHDEPICRTSPTLMQIIKEKNGEAASREFEGFLKRVLNFRIPNPSTDRQEPEQPTQKKKDRNIVPSREGSLELYSGWGYNQKNLQYKRKKKIKQTQ